jgi:hypothetical protein
MAELRMLRKQRDALDDQIQRLEWQLSNTDSDSETSGARVPRPCLQDCLLASLPARRLPACRAPPASLLCSPRPADRVL